MPPIHFDAAGLIAGIHVPGELAPPGEGGVKEEEDERSLLERKEADDGNASIIIIIIIIMHFRPWHTRAHVAQRLLLQPALLSSSAQASNKIPQ